MTYYGSLVWLLLHSFLSIHAHTDFCSVLPANQVGSVSGAYVVCTSLENPDFFTNTSIESSSVLAFAFVGAVYYDYKEQIVYTLVANQSAPCGTPWFWFLAINLETRVIDRHSPINNSWLPASDIAYDSVKKQFFYMAQENGQGGSPSIIVIDRDTFVPEILWSFPTGLWCAVPTAFIWHSRKRQLHFLAYQEGPNYFESQFVTLDVDNKMWQAIVVPCSDPQNRPLQLWLDPGTDSFYSIVGYSNDFISHPTPMYLAHFNESSGLSVRVPNAPNFTLPDYLFAYYDPAYDTLSRIVYLFTNYSWGPIRQPWRQAFP